MKTPNFNSFTKKEKFSVALLLWVTAHVDGTLHPIEIFDVKVSLKNLFGISDDEAKELIAKVDKVKFEDEFVSKAIEDLSRYFSPELKEKLVQLSCNIALSDRVVHESETEFTQLIAEELIGEAN